MSIIDVPDAKQLAQYTADVHANNRLAYSLAGLQTPRPDAEPVLVPLRHGEPPVFKHVIYVIKENRSYDQILGDVKDGNGDPDLCLYWAKKSLELDFDKEDEAEGTALNRILWHSVRGYETPYPERFDVKQGAKEGTELPRR